MSVIGRLDKQVDDLLITPLSRKPHANDDAGTKQPSPVLPAQIRERRDEEDRREDTGDREELPVWLL
ncbi:MAG TPA: hypothetical protein VM934_00030 [Pyrinomonadaceae bacterium]|nr:hypothetical protein [Pyrinomonadaceae bacterium]